MVNNLGLLQDRTVGFKHTHTKHAHTQCIYVRTNMQSGGTNLLFDAAYSTDSGKE